MHAGTRRERVWLALATPYRRWCARNSVGRYAVGRYGGGLEDWLAPDAQPPGRRSVEPRRDRVAANARLTGTTAALLLVLLATEGVTILRIAPLVRPHVVIGMALVPVVALKIGSTTYRFARYYLKAADFRAKGPPPLPLRVLGPFLVLLTVAVLATGIALVFAGQASSLGQRLLLAHKVSFVAWIALLAVHVLAHLRDTARLAPQDWYRRTRRQVIGASRRQWALAASLCAGLLLGVALLPQVAHYVTT